MTIFFSNRLRSQSSVVKDSELPNATLVSNEMISNVFCAVVESCPFPSRLETNEERNAIRLIQFFGIISENFQEAEDFLQSTVKLSDLERAAAIRGWMGAHAMRVFANLTEFDWSAVSRFPGISTEALLLPNLNANALKLALKSIIRRRDFQGLAPFLEDSHFRNWPFAVQKEVLYALSFAGNIELVRKLLEKTDVGQNDVSHLNYSVGVPLLFGPIEWGESFIRAIDGEHIALVKQWMGWEFFASISASDLKRAKKLAELKCPEFSDDLRKKLGWWNLNPFNI